MLKEAAAGYIEIAGPNNITHFRIGERMIRVMKLELRANV
jgi:hypothetical protein